MRFESHENRNIAVEDQWKRISADVDRIHDGLGKEIDPGIKEMIVAFRALGFKTTASCEGHLDCGVQGPWVDLGYVPEDLADRIRVTVRAGREVDLATQRERIEVGRELQREQLRLMGLLTEFYENRTVALDQRIILEFYGGERTRIINQGTGIQSARPLNEQRKNLEKYRNEMKEFSNFLRRKFFEPSFHSGV